MNWPELPQRRQLKLEDLRPLIGQAMASVWLAVDQAMIDTFAAATGDDAFIHTDPAAAAGTRFKGTIAHGLLSLSLLPWLMRSALPDISDRRMGVNYGYDSVRFITPVPCGARVRGHFTVTGIEPGKGAMQILRLDVSLEIEGQVKPAVVATWLLGIWIRTDGGQT
jgi:acyl dehydratase